MVKEEMEVMEVVEVREEAEVVEDPMLDQTREHCQGRTLVSLHQEEEVTPLEEEVQEEVLNLLQDEVEAEG